MGRERKRTWPQRVYRYCFQPRCIPERLWAVAKIQQRLWNELCTLSALAAGQAKADPTQKRLHWWCWEHNARALVVRSGLNWELGPDVLDRFRTALKGIGKNDKGPPRPHYRLERVRLMHRYTGGGVPFTALQSARVWRARIELSRPGHGHQPAVFGVDRETPIEGTIVYHRPIPDAAIVKQVALCGELRGPFGWQWTMNVTVEEPPPAAVSQPDMISYRAGLDLGWRVMGDYLRIGVLVDSCGEEVELRLPFDGSNRDTRRAGIASDWRDLRRQDADMDGLLEQTKTAILPRLTTAGLTMPVMAWQRLRDRGLRRILAAEGTPAEVREILAWWRARHTFLWRRRAGLQYRLIAQRRDRYRVLAQWLCRRYSTIALECDMMLKDLAEGDCAGEPALKAAQRYRVIASLSELRLYIQQAAARTGTTVIGTAANTTRICAECNKTIESGPRRVLTCVNGHAVDQDANAGRNLLSQTNSDNRQVRGLRKKGPRRDAKRLGIPAILKAVAVPCSLE